MGVLFSAKRRTKNECGATVIEYSLLLSLISCVCITCIFQLGTDTSLAFARLSQAGIGLSMRGEGGGGGSLLPHPGRGGGSWGTGEAPPPPPPPEY